MSLTCVSLGFHEVWYYDDTVMCFSYWQVSMAALCITYILPFPFMLNLGMRLLQEKLISGVNFLCDCFLPLLFSVYWSILKFKIWKKVTRNSKIGNIEMNISLNQRDGKEKDVKSSSNILFPLDHNMNITEVILRRFQGPCNVKNERARYWESFMILRRLLLGTTTLIPNTMYQMASCSDLCLIFLMHHFSAKPFVSNKVESFSLLLLCLVSIINLFKSVYIQVSIIPEGPGVNFFRIL